MKNMPDIAHSTAPQSPRRLNRVGMSQVDVPLMVSSGSGRNAMSTRVPGQVSGFVSLDDPEARGIHMSRIYRILANELPSKPVSFEHLQSLLEHLLSSHAGISETAEIVLRYSHLAEMPALLSGLRGWRHYPVMIRASKTRNGQTSLDFALRLTYSSTCPCSAALSRQLNQNQFADAFGTTGQIDAAKVHAWLGDEHSVGGEPHAQRSHGIVVLRFSRPGDLPVAEELAARLETALGTPVQTAVKREDEQEFARLNARNLMFSEDAARKLAQTLESIPCDDFLVHVIHYESLHPYNVEATATKGIEGGLVARDIESIPELLEGFRK